MAINVIALPSSASRYFTNAQFRPNSTSKQVYYLRNDGTVGVDESNCMQTWDASKGELQNGIFLGHLAALTFYGYFDADGVGCAEAFS